MSCNIRSAWGCTCSHITREVPEALLTLRLHGSHDRAQHCEKRRRSAWKLKEGQHKHASCLAPISTFGWDSNCVLSVWTIIITMCNNYKLKTKTQYNSQHGSMWWNLQMLDTSSLWHSKLVWTTAGAQDIEDAPILWHFKLRGTTMRLHIRNTAGVAFDRLTTRASMEVLVNGHA